MTSAVKATRNETAWAPHNQPPRLASNGKIPQFLNSNSNPNPNPNPNPKTINPHHNHVNGGGGDDDASPSFSHYVSYDITGYSRSEIRSLKNRFKLELDRVRHLSSRIESGEYFNSKKRSFPQPDPNPKRLASNSPPMARYRASGSVMKQCMNVLVKLMRQKMGYVFNTPVDAVELGLHDYHSIIKNPMDLGTIKSNMIKNVYPTPDEFAADVRLTFNNALKYNPKGHEVHTMAQQYLSKFEQLFLPVYDKYQTEKLQFQQREKQRHQKVENSWVLDGGDGNVVDGLGLVDQNVNEAHGSSWVKQASPEVSKKPMVPKRVEQVEPPPPLPCPEPPRRLTPPPPAPALTQPPPAPVLTPPPVVAPTQSVVRDPAQIPVAVPLTEVVGVQVKGNVGRGPSGKLPKPKAKDPNKRPMSMEEKHKLGNGLQSLPDEKMAQVIQIMRKRNGQLTQDGDEIELDIEAVDIETLWELDRFVTNYKKWASKVKRQALMGVPNDNVAHNSTVNQVVGVSERVSETSKTKKSSGDVGEEDVDIGDEMPVENFPPLEIERDDDRQQGGGVGDGGSGGGDSISTTSSSSSSSDDSSSSSDSDSSSSSDSDSDVDDAQSRDNGSKNIHL